MKKTITLFYTDATEKATLQPIYDEAQRRGYNARFTSNISLKCEIGIYCQHVPCLLCKNSKFSVILLHDLAQRHDIWPKFWNYEPWCIFDIGILPGDDWVKRWMQNSHIPFANPRQGVYGFGWPKADKYVNNAEFLKSAEEFKKSLNFPFEKTVLFAPSWEYGGRQSRFAEIMSKLPFNLIIKQGPLCKGLPDHLEYYVDVYETENSKTGKYENVRILDPRTNIMEVLPLADLVVSEESSVMYEALMFGIPSIAVSDWLVPDRNPPRPPFVPTDLFEKCREDELAVRIIQAMEKQADKDLLKSSAHVNYLGESSGKIMDLIECHINNDYDNKILEERIKPSHVPQEPFEIQSDSSQDKTVDELNISVLKNKHLMLNNWIYKKKLGFEFSDFFIKNGWLCIGIFGMEEITERLIEELLDTYVKVMCVIDVIPEPTQGVIVKEREFPFYSLDQSIKSNLIAQLDVVVVINDDFFKKIDDLLSKLLHCPVVKLSDITAI